MGIDDDRAWLLRSRFNPHPIAGSLVIAAGEISFRVDDGEIDAESIAWLEARVKSDGVAARLASGESVLAFSNAIGECEVTWPITGGGGTMVVETPERRWVVSVEGRTCGPFQSAIGLVSARRRAREWKRALAETEIETAAA